MAVRIHPIRMGLSVAYLIEGDSGMVLVDAGLPGREHAVMRRLRVLARDDVKLIFITHAHIDHYGSAAALRRLTGAPIGIHHRDADAMACGETRVGSVRGWGRVAWPVMRPFERLLRPAPTPPDVLLEDGDDLRAYGVDAVVLHTPGHTPGSACLIVQGQWAFVGDLLSTSLWPHIQQSYADDWSLLQPSLRRLQMFAPCRTYAGHGRRPLSRDALQRLTYGRPRFPKRVDRSRRRRRIN
jgi:glyoxylase-like metal-dependent hydrolase (beta-lactamase superfamily II)